MERRGNYGGIKANSMKYREEQHADKAGRIKLINYLPHIGIDKAREEIIKGLKAQPKYISSKYFYDEKGARLFEEITLLDEYYPTRTEKKIIAKAVKALNIDFSGLNIIDLGSGDHSKIRLFFNQVPQEYLSEITYYPVDISQSTIERAAEKLLDEFPVLKIEGIVADFMHQLHLAPKNGKRLFCFFGSTIGNFEPDQVKDFMHALGGQMREGDAFLLGLDMVKDIAVLEKAYNDAKGVTAEFNKNILNVVNNLSDTDFNSRDFEHWAFYNTDKKRIEMHLKAKKDVDISLSGKPFIHLRKGETIHTENSHKFDKSDIKSIGAWAGLTVDKVLSDENECFSLVYYKK